MYLRQVAKTVYQGRKPTGIVTATTLGFVAHRHLLMTLSLPNSTPQLLAWHDLNYTRTDALEACPYFNEVPSKMLAQEDSFIANGDKYGWTYHSLAGGDRTIAPDVALQQLQAVAADPSQFVGAYNYHGFFKPFFVKFFELMGESATLISLWDVCDLAWIYRAYLAEIPAERFRTVDDIAQVFDIKVRGSTNITALAGALELDVPKAESYADNDFARVQAVYQTVFANT